jgi:hypothetical protein
MTNPRKLARLAESLEWHNKRIASSHRPSLQGRRHIKGRAKHIGVVIRSSRIVHDVPLERVFVKKP